MSACERRHREPARNTMVGEVSCRRGDRRSATRLTWLRVIRDRPADVIKRSFIFSDGVGASHRRCAYQQTGGDTLRRDAVFAKYHMVMDRILPILRGVANSCVARGPTQHHFVVKHRSEIPETRHSGDGEMNFWCQMAPGSPHSKHAQCSGIFFNKDSMYELDDRRQNDAMI